MQKRGTRSSTLTKIAAALADHLDGRKKLETATQDLQNESRERQAADEQLVELCRRVLSQSKMRRKTQRRVDSECEIWVTQFAVANGICSLDPAAFVSTTEAVIMERKRRNQLFRIHSVKTNCDAATHKSTEERHNSQSTVPSGTNS